LPFVKPEMKTLVIKKYSSLFLTCLHSRMTLYTRVCSLFLAFFIPLKFQNTLELIFFAALSISS